MVIKSFEKSMMKAFTKNLIEGDSQKAYMSYMRTIINGTFPKAKTTVVLKDTETVLKFINSHYKDGARTAVAAVATLIKNKRGYGDTYLLYKKSMDDKVKIRKINQKLNKVPEKLKQVVNSDTFTSLGDKIVSELKTKLDKALEGTDFKKSFGLYELYILALIILKGGFIERLSYFDFLLKKHTGNYISGGAKMYFNEFKNVGDIGKQVKTLPDEIKTEIKKYLKFKNNKTHLFYNEKFINKDLNKAYTKKAFSKLIMKISKVAGLENILTMNDYRKLFETELQNSPRYQNMSIAERDNEHITKAFHQRAIAETTYRLKK